MYRKRLVCAAYAQMNTPPSLPPRFGEGWGEVSNETFDVHRRME